MSGASERRVAMCLMAHPDDCEILAAGTLAHLARRGWEVHIATMSPGDCGSADLGPEAISAIRRAEGAAGAAIIGATYHCLESRDLYIMFDEPTLRRVCSLMRAIAPSLVITNSPDDYMVDHEMASKLARSATFGYPIPNVVPGAILPGSGIPHLYYADALEGKDILGRPITPGLYVDIAETLDTKTEMLCAHASQREWLRAHHGMDQYVVSMKAWASKRGRECGLATAEGFRQHLGHAYPQDCLLARELGDSVVRL
ncbi:MAG: PIG-L family deacetylase [Armatimonadetes bacterium]|nr:PIG-L family deacetylase [Armatimonadota bacterium]